MKKDIKLSGVGGQGILSIATVIGEAATEAGLQLKQAEVHGMSQRGGDVVTHVKISDGTVSSPLIEKGEADIIIGFEKLEAYRWLPQLKKGGAMFVNTQEILPMPVVMGQAEYPENIDGVLAETAGSVKAFDAMKIASECGSTKAVNVVLLGAASEALPFSEEEWMKVIEENVKPKFVELNKKAFTMGQQA